MGFLREIVAVEKKSVVRYEVPEWGRVIYLRGIGLGQRTTIANEANSLNGASEATKNDLVTRRMVFYGVCTEAGEQAFAEEEFNELGLIDASVLDRIALKVSSLSRLGADDVKELEKNFGATQTAGSASS